MFDSSRFYAAFAQHGLLVDAAITSGVHSGETVAVDFQQPDREIAAGAGVHLSPEYEIEYQQADLPGLAKDDTLTIGGVHYKVRQPTFVREEGNASDGTFRRAILTAV